MRTVKKKIKKHQRRESIPLDKNLKHQGEREREKKRKNRAMTTWKDILSSGIENSHMINSRLFSN